MNKILLAYTVLLIAISASANATSVQNPLNPPAQPKVIAELTHKNGKTYELRKKYYLNHGMNTYTYDFGSNETGYSVIYKGSNYTDGNKCPSSEDNKKYASPDTVLIKHIFYQRDFNQDGVEDIDLSLATQNCKTGEVTFFEKLIQSNKTGYEIKTFQ